MDYIKIHAKFIDYFNTTTPSYRLHKRDSHDERLKHSIDLYVERHHITPRSLGGLDVNSNLVTVLPEEHIFLHALRYKAFDHRGDMLAVRFALNGFNSKGYIRHSCRLTKAIRAGYSFIKTEVYNFRMKHGWQTEEGRKAISKARSGQIPVIDAITKEPRGSVTKDDPRYLSGELTHHTKGYLTVIELSTGKKKRISSVEYQQNKHLFTNNNDQKGKNNGRYSGISDEDIIAFGKTLSMQLGHIASYKELYVHYRKIGVMVPKRLSSMRFKSIGTKEYIRLLQSELPNLPYVRNGNYKKDNI